jgi:hypothetical protein
MKDATTLLLALLLVVSSCLLRAASSQDVDASTWGGHPGKPNKPPRNCPVEQPFDPKTFNWGSIYTAYPGMYSGRLLVAERCPTCKVHGMHVQKLLD